MRHSPKNVGDSVVRRTRSGERQLTGGLIPQLALYLIKRNPPKRSIVILGAVWQKKMKLTCYCGPGGLIPLLSDPIRLVLHLAGIDYEDDRRDIMSMERAERAEMMKETPTGSFPVLSLDDGTTITESIAVLRYVGRLTGLYPADAQLAAQVDSLEAVSPNQLWLMSTLITDGHFCIVLHYTARSSSRQSHTASFATPRGRSTRR